jgi:hypothetical protein
MASNPSKKMIIRNVRFSYFKGFKAEKTKDGIGVKFSTAVLLPKDHPQIPEIKQTITDLINEKWPQKKPNGLKKPLRDGDDSENGRPDDPAYAGHWFFNAYADVSQPPGIIDGNKNKLEPSSGWQSGDYGNVSISFYVFDRSDSKGVAAGLNNIQFTRKGESLTGRTSADQDFDVEEVDAGEDMFG